MFNIDAYMVKLIDLLKQTFGNHLSYVGLQGSYFRGEADEESDIDVMVILDELSIADMKRYKDILHHLGSSDKACGFLCGKADLQSWNPLEICHLLHTTKDYYGMLKTFIPAYSENDIKKYIQFSLDNLYHALCHRYVHSSQEECKLNLPGLYKPVFFILQNMHFLKSGNFIQTQSALLPLLSEDDRRILQKAMELRGHPSIDSHHFEETYALLFHWCQIAKQKTLHF